ncbi:MAG: DNA methyltransferase [bacterium]
MIKGAFGDNPFNYMKYLVLGKNQALSLAEIVSVYKKKNSIIGKNIILIDEYFDIKKSVAELGGVIKGGKIIGNLENSDKEIIRKWITEYVFKLLAEGMIKKEKKFSFGFSVYSDRDKFNRNFIKKMAMDLKKILREQGINSRWVVSKEEDNLSSIVVGENKLYLENNGFEANIIDIDNKIYIGETEIVQNYMEYSKLDYGRPLRDARAGMLPVKLAKIMINLSGAEIENTILDPFCGSGTILQEALIIGHKKIIGSDFSKQAMENSEKNIEWLKKNYPEITKEKDLLLINTPVEKLSGAIKKETISAIVTEPYLGPPIRKGVLFDIQKIIKNLSKVYLKSFIQFKEVLKNNGVVVMIWPIFKDDNGIYKFMPIMKEIEEMGFKKVDLLPIELMEYVKKKYGQNIVSKRNTIIYSREDQYIKREIVKFIKK